MSHDEYDFSQAKQGPVIKSIPGKTRITIRIDTETLHWFRRAVHEAGGGNYQTVINEALRQFVSQQENVLEDVVRRVIREELAPYHLEPRDDEDGQNA